MSRAYCIDHPPDGTPMGLATFLALDGARTLRQAEGPGRISIVLTRDGQYAHLLRDGYHCSCNVLADPTDLQGMFWWMIQSAHCTILDYQHYPAPDLVCRHYWRLEGTI